MRRFIPEIHQKNTVDYDLPGPTEYNLESLKQMQKHK